MLSDIKLRGMSPDDRGSVIDIFNHYIENSFAAFPENKVGYEFYDMFLNMTKGYPTVVVTNDKDEVLGFGFLRCYNPMPAFRKTAEITYFIKPEHTGKGIGKVMFEFLCDGARKMNISCILACISSLNEGSIRFHKNNGFKECGCFVDIGSKKGCNFDVVWMQKHI